MKTPIVNFIQNYKKEKSIRFHMPGHKGKKHLGFEDSDITEIDGADVLYHSEGIIEESRQNASTLFGHPTFYSTEGSSLCIRAMLFLALQRYTGKHPYVLAARNVHKTFITASALLHFDVKWMYSTKETTYHETKITKEDVKKELEAASIMPFAVYLTSPDYLGNISDIEGIAKVCKSFKVPLLVDNAHGAYLHFIEPSLHPMDLGATMVCDSAHKTFPTITGGAYLHIQRDEAYLLENAKSALSLFASTSPSYLILESLDYTNLYLEENKRNWTVFLQELNIIKKELIQHGYTLVGQEPMKITIDASSFGYTGSQLASVLKNNRIYPEFYDADFLVLMPTMDNTKEELSLVKDVLCSIEPKPSISHKKYIVEKNKPILSIHDAMFSKKEKVDVSESLGRILADLQVSCPPAIPILVVGEKIDEKAIELFQYYGIDTLTVVKK